MVLKEQLSADMLTAMKAKDGFKRDCLRVIIGEISREEGKLLVGEALLDSDIQKIISKSIKNLEMLGTDEAKKEVTILEPYLPKRMTEAETISEVNNIVDRFNSPTMKDMGLLINIFNIKFYGKADGKLVASLIKQRLS
jgi:hypothetical protein